MGATRVAGDDSLRLPWMRMGRGVVWLHASRYNGTGVFVAFVIGDQILMRAKPLCILVHVVVPVFLYMQSGEHLREPFLYTFF